MTLLHRTARLAAAVLVTVAATTAGLVGAPTAQAATCSTSAGASVVVDPGSLGGPVQSGCVAGGRTPAALFPDAGFPLTYVQSQPGFVCRVAGQPSGSDEACVDTPAANAYWGLWWSDGRTGTWTYASYGVSGFRVPEGGSVAFVWQDSSSRTAPAVAPAVNAAPASAASTPTASPTRQPSAKPTRQPTRQPTQRPTQRPTRQPSTEPTPRPSPAPSSSPSASVSASAPVSTSASPSVAPSIAPSVAPSAPAPVATPSWAVPSPSEVLPSSAASDAPYDDASPASATADGALPAWVAPLVIVLVLGGAAGAFVVRRRRQSTG